MRLLVVNANTSDIVTEKVAAQARASASAGTEVVAVTGTFGGRVIGTRTDCQMLQTGTFGFGTFTTVNGMQVGRAGAAVAPLPNGGASARSG